MRMPGEKIKQYVIESLIGSGSFGKVYKVHDNNNEKKIYALKEIDIQDKPNKNYLEGAIQREISIMKRIENENSVKLIEEFEYDDCNYLVLELCDGDLNGEYKRYIKKKKKPYNELGVYMIMSQLNNCFKKMREGDEKVIHRDLKLDNILIKYDKNVPIIGFTIKLSDFGLSKTMKENDMTATNVGTPITKAPEIFLKTDYTHKVDLWSIGIIMYQLLFKGEIPFKVKTSKELVNELKKFKKLTLPDAMRKSLSDECFDLLNHLLVKEENERIDFEDYFEHKFFSEEHKMNY